MEALEGLPTWDLQLKCCDIKSAGDLNGLVMRYQCSTSVISEVVNELSFWIDDRRGKLLGFDTEGILAPEKLASYAHAIHEADAPLLSIWAFLNCTIRAMCQPFRHQRQAYNGYKKAVKLPNGLLGHVHGPELISPFSGAGEHTDDKKRWNEAMARVRIEVEHGFGDITAQYFNCNPPALDEYIHD
ncbi:hypothetical protein L208DRAFT_1420824 [Tricholoma matsutake]|nr:hypothetical protein L208DRAFT_1420824 [Tricholoma matsutake 945]